MGSQRARHNPATKHTCWENVCICRSSLLPLLLGADPHFLSAQFPVYLAHLQLLPGTVHPEHHPRACPSLTPRYPPLPTKQSNESPPSAKENWRPSSQLPRRREGQVLTKALSLWFPVQPEPGEPAPPARSSGSPWCPSLTFFIFNSRATFFLSVDFGNGNDPSTHSLAVFFFIVLGAIWHTGHFVCCLASH